MRRAAHWLAVTNVHGIWLQNLDDQAYATQGTYVLGMVRGYASPWQQTVAATAGQCLKVHLHLILLLPRSTEDVGGRW